MLPNHRCEPLFVLIGWRNLPNLIGRCSYILQEYCRYQSPHKTNEGRGYSISRRILRILPIFLPTNEWHFCLYRSDYVSYFCDDEVSLAVSSVVPRVVALRSNLTSVVVVNYRGTSFWFVFASDLFNNFALIRPTFFRSIVFNLVNFGSGFFSGYILYLTFSEALRTRIVIIAPIM